MEFVVKLARRKVVLRCKYVLIDVYNLFVYTGVSSTQAPTRETEMPYTTDEIPERYLIEARRHVKLGALFLDEIRPDWRSDIDRGQLGQLSCHDCILGQLYRSWIYIFIAYVFLVLRIYRRSSLNPEFTKRDVCMGGGYVRGYVVLRMSCEKLIVCGFVAWDPLGNTSLQYAALNTAWIEILDGTSTAAD